MPFAPVLRDRVGGFVQHHPHAAASVDFAIGLRVPKCPCCIRGAWSKSPGEGLGWFNCAGYVVHCYTRPIRFAEYTTNHPEPTFDSLCGDCYRGLPRRLRRLYVLTYR